MCTYLRMIYSNSDNSIYLFTPNIYVTIHVLLLNKVFEMKRKFREIGVIPSYLPIFFKESESEISFSQHL